MFGRNPLESKEFRKPLARPDSAGYDPRNGPLRSRPGRPPPASPPKPMRLQRLALALPLVLASCGGGAADPAALADAGTQSLRTGDFSAAVTDFDRALAAIGDDTAHAEFMRASMGRIEALTQLDAGTAKAEFLALREKLGEAITERNFQTIAGRMGDAGAFDEAIELVTVAKADYPESKVLDALVQALGDQAKAAGAAGALDSLKGLGYVGD